MKDKERMTSAGKRYKKNKDVVSRKIGEQFMLVPMRSNSSELDSIFTLNEAAGAAWELLDAKRTVKEVCAELLKEFEAQENVIQYDVYAFLEACLEHKLIVEVK